MRIEKIEQVILTEEEYNILENSLKIIDEVYGVCEEKGELEKQTSNIITPLNDFINSAKVVKY